MSHDPSEIILICWFAAQETFLIIINKKIIIIKKKTVVLFNVFVEILINFFFRILWWKVQKKSITLCLYCHFYVILLSPSWIKVLISFKNKILTDPEILNSTVCSIRIDLHNHCVELDMICFSSHRIIFLPFKCYLTMSPIWTFSCT